MSPPHPRASRSNRARGAKEVADIHGEVRLATHHPWDPGRLQRHATPIQGHTIGISGTHVDQLHGYAILPKRSAIHW